MRTPIDPIYPLQSLLSLSPLVLISSPPLEVLANPNACSQPSFNQFVFFEVQPGHSFHSVEEVAVVGDGQKGGVGARVSLSGWFHKPVEGEEGYEGSESFMPKSSLQQLVRPHHPFNRASYESDATPGDQYATTLSAPTPYPEPLSLPLPTVPSSSDLAYLSKYLNSAYTSPKIISHLRSQFVETSHLVLSDFLSPSIATELASLIKAKDLETEKGRRGVTVNGQKVNLIPAHTTGEEQGWQVVGPPHLQRYLSLSTSTSPSERLETLLIELQTLLQSSAFASLIATLTSLLPVAHTTNIRRFRPGLDYTLARGEPAANEGEEGNEEEGPQAKLDIGLNLTPKEEKEEDQEIWEGGEAGGWDIWLVGDEGGDEATYGGGGGGKSKSEESEKENGAEQTQEGEQEEEMEEDDSTLLSLEPTFNRLHLVLRDPGVLGFVKYVSAKAPGSRWDVSGEWEVRGIEEDDGEEEQK